MQDKKILIMDDDIDFAESLGDVLSIKGYNYKIVTNPSEIWDIIESFIPQVILMDIKLVHRGGINVLKKLKKRGVPVIVIVMTPYSDVDIVVNSLQNGAYDYLKKPVNIDELFSILNRSYEKLELEHKKKEAEKNLEIRNMELEAVNLKLMREKEHAEIRVKEVNCLFSISHMLNKPNITLNEILKKTVEIIPSAFRYPEAMCVKIVLDSKVVCSKNCSEYKECSAELLENKRWILSHPIYLYDKYIGKIMVWHKNGNDKVVSTFLKEEYGLVNAVAELLGSIVERKKSEDELVRSLNMLRNTMEGIIQAMVMTTEMRDPYTAGHQRRVAKLAVAIAEEMKIKEEDIAGIRMAAVIHDLGKIYVPAELLTKPGKITDLEFSIIKTHSQVGHDILKNIEFPWPLAKIIYQHHERVDGSGYPLGIKGEEILLPAKIIGVADTVEAMASHRPYRPALGVDQALAEIKKYSGIHYEKDIVDICVKLFKDKGFSFEE